MSEAKTRTYETKNKKVTVIVEDKRDGGEAAPFYDVVCSRKKLGQIFTSATELALDDFYSFFGSFARDFHINEEVNENFFLAQVKAEVGTDLLSVRENLNYSCSALQGTFSYYSNSPNEANQDGRCSGHEANQTDIGNKAYANRIGNGSVASGDGYRFRGGGFFQLTGRANYDQAAETINKVLATGYGMTAEELADIITEVGAGSLSAMSFWLDNDLESCSNIDCCTGKINYYTDSYATRKQYYQEIAAIPPGGN